MLIDIRKKILDDTATPEFLGGKGYGLYWMAQKGINVPPALILPTSNCKNYQASPTSPKEVMEEFKGWIPEIRKIMTGHFGYMPLLSVRSGARVSMPGMMDTILNVGLDSTTEELWLKKLGKGCLENSMHRLVTMYGNVVKGLDRHELEKGGAQEALKYYTKKTGESFPDMEGQLLGSVEAVFKSWNNERAKVYRRMHNIPDEWGTAVVIQAMVFGNLNDKSGSGVMFTRNPDTGEDKIVGEFLVNAQGEDVVAGTRTPIPLSEIGSLLGMAVGNELLEMAETLELSRGDVQDVEFTIQDGELFILQTRSAKRSASASIRIAVEMYKEGVIDSATAVKRVSPKEYDLAQSAVIDPAFTLSENYTGIPACSGVVTGKPVFSTKDAINCKVPCILITQETTPDDIEGMEAAAGILTMTGGATSHAAVIARGMNKPCVVGLGELKASFTSQTIVSIDGATGRVWLGQVPVVDGKKNPYTLEYKKLLQEAKGFIPVFSTSEVGFKEQLLDLSGTKVLFGDHMDMAYKVCEALKKSERVYVDISTSGMPKVEKEYALMLMEESKFDSMETKFLEAMSKDVDKKDRSRITVISTIMPFAIIKEGYKAMALVDSLEGLIMAQGEVVYGEVKTPDVVWARVMVMKNLAGDKFTPVSIGKIKEGAKSFVSIEQALLM